MEPMDQFEDPTGESMDGEVPQEAPVSIESLAAQVQAMQAQIDELRTMVVPEEAKAEEAAEASEGESEAEAEQEEAQTPGDDGNKDLKKKLLMKAMQKA